MKTILTCFTIFTLATCITLAEERRNAMEEAVLKVEQQWEDALTKSDSKGLEQIYDATLIYTHSNGKVDTKSSFIAAIKSGATQYQSMKRDDIKVSIYGQAAVVTCHWEVHVLAQGNKIDMNARYLHVYALSGAEWKLVAHQSTRIAQ